MAAATSHSAAINNSTPAIAQPQFLLNSFPSYLAFRSSSKAFFAAEKSA